MPCTKLAATTLLGMTLAAQAHAGRYDVAPNIGVGIALAAINPAAAPDGANLARCHSRVDPYPVVLVNGTFSVMQSDFAALAPHLANAGYCVYTFNYGGAYPTAPIQAIGPVATSVQQLATFVQQVKAATGAARIDMVGHSQGGMLTEYYAKVLQGAANIHTIVALSPTTHGTTLDGLTNLAAFFPGANALVQNACPACSDQEVGSAIIDTLDQGPIAQTGVNYTIIETLNENVVTPVGSSFINEAGVLNEYVQSFCPYDTVDHMDLSYDNVVFQLIQNALAPKSAHQPSCRSEFPASAK